MTDFLKATPRPWRLGERAIHLMCAQCGMPDPNEVCRTLAKTEQL